MALSQLLDDLGAFLSHLFRNWGSSEPDVCVHGQWNANQTECICDSTWSTDPEQDPLSGKPFVWCNTTAYFPDGSTSVATKATVNVKVIGIVVGVVGVVLVLLGLLVYCCCCRRRCCSKDASREGDRAQTGNAATPAVQNNRNTPVSPAIPNARSPPAVAAPAVPAAIASPYSPPTQHLNAVPPLVPMYLAQGNYLPLQPASRVATPMYVQMGAGVVPVASPLRLTPIAASPSPMHAGALPPQIPRQVPGVQSPPAGRRMLYDPRTGQFYNIAENGTDAVRVEGSTAPEPHAENPAPVPAVQRSRRPSATEGTAAAASRATTPNVQRTPSQRSPNVGATPAPGRHRVAAASSGPQNDCLSPHAPQPWSARLVESPPAYYPPPPVAPPAGYTSVHAQRTSNDRAATGYRNAPFA